MICVYVAISHDLCICRYITWFVYMSLYHLICVHAAILNGWCHRLYITWFVNMSLCHMAWVITVSSFGPECVFNLTQIGSY